jgi:iron-only hydrogenase group A
MLKIVNLIIDGQKYKAEASQTILEVAQKNNLKIDSLCHHPDVAIQSSCRLCSVEVKGKSGLFTACSIKVSEGLEIITKSPAIDRAKRINLELIFTEHCEECGDCLYKEKCKIKDLAKELDVSITKYPDRKKGYSVQQFGPALIFQSDKCVDCGLCIEICKKEGVCFLEYKKKKNFFTVVPSDKPDHDCIYCGQCITHCPVGAFEGVGEFEEATIPLDELAKGKVVVVQIAPSVRSTIGEEFGMPFGSVVTGRLIGAIKKLGIKYVFDTSVGADVTTVEEAEELIERLKQKKNLPMFTSCCPGWVKYAEFFRPDLLPKLTTVRSPHVIMGGLIKTYWAQKNKIDPKDIFVISIMPCVAKKYEVERIELKINGLKPVDYAITTRAFANLLKRQGLDLKNIEPANLDPFFSVPSGAGVIYGASGGVMESALRTASQKITGQVIKKIDFQVVRGIQGFKKATIKIGKHSLKVAVVNGMTSAKKVLEELDKDPRVYDYIEVMACFGGCIGGGGQPVPVNDQIRKLRAQGLYNIDKKNKIRTADDNPIIKEIYKNYLSNEKNKRPVCHTHFLKKDKEVYSTDFKK